MSAADPFVAHRSLLFTIAYELLGSAADAEDVVQDAWLRWVADDRSGVHDPRAYAAQIVTRTALNRLRTVQRRRESYVGPWLPEPILTAPDVADDVVLADSVSWAMLVVLDSLSPVERAVFLLREVFGYSYDEIAEMVGRRADAVRQIAHRARGHVSARRPARAPDAELRDATARFARAAETGDPSELLALIAPDVVLVTDGGGVRRAALRPIVGPEKVLRFLFAVRQEGSTIRPVEANGGPALVAEVDGEVDAMILLELIAGAITRILVQCNPDKLVGLAPHALARGGRVVTEP